jgi:thiol-disulfide isomerase/thioredoxin
MSRRPQRRSSSAWFFGIGVAVVLAIGVVAILVTRGGNDEGGVDSDTGAVEIAAAVSVDGQALPTGTGTDDAAIGMRAPVAGGQNFDGSPVTVGEGGRPQLVVFLAHWCPHCQAEVPRLVAFDAAGGFPTGLDVVAVATGTMSSRPNYPPSAWLEREGWTRPVLVDTSNGSVANAYGVSGFPYFVLLDAEGRVLARDSGELTEDQLRELVAMAVASIEDSPAIEGGGQDEEPSSPGSTGAGPPTGP